MNRLTSLILAGVLGAAVALAGGAGYGAAKIHAKQIAKDAIRTKHIKAGSVTGDKVAAGSITGGKLGRLLLPGDRDDEWCPVSEMRAFKSVVPGACLGSGTGVRISLTGH